jgi:hypothetical protein
LKNKNDDYGKKENDAMVPIQFRNFSYPLVWISQEYFVNKQQKNTTEDEVVEWDKMLHDKIFASAMNVSEENVTRKASRSINKQLSTSLRTTQGIQFTFCLSES